MIEMIKKFFLLPFLFFLISCGGGGWDTFEGALTGQKKRTTDEYLIKKKDPLILPPDYKKLPLPDSKKAEDKPNRIESILSKTESSKMKKKSPLETSIEKELRNGN
tara:strand:+ start:266 stop:583 length:318 start_codon:yes stop_codon:yes gene_type:complete